MKSVHIAHKSYTDALIHQIKNIIKSQNQVTSAKSENHVKRIKMTTYLKVEKGSGSKNTNCIIVVKFS
jgi:hypothetical protein